VNLNLFFGRSFENRFLLLVIDEGHLGHSGIESGRDGGLQDLIIIRVEVALVLDRDEADLSEDVDQLSLVLHRVLKDQVGEAQLVAKVLCLAVMFRIFPFGEDSGNSKAYFT